MKSLILTALFLQLFSETCPGVDTEVAFNFEIFQDCFGRFTYFSTKKLISQKTSVPGKLQIL